MDKHPQSRAPLIVAISLLLLPVLYVGSYFALVVPGSPADGELYFVGDVDYRAGGVWSERIFSPLEQIDRKLRPGVWASPYAK